MQDVKLSENFMLSEFTRSETAIRKYLPNEPGPHHVENLKLLCKHVLQPLRDKLGPVIILSGYRSRPVNTAIGGSPNSQHMQGQAADIRVLGKSVEEVTEWIKANVKKYDQLIHEFGEWTHVSYDKDNLRKMNLRATKMGMRTIYSPYDR